MKAITLCVNRFDEETKTAFLDLYTKVDAKINAPKVEASVAPTVAPNNDEVPF